MTTQTANVLRLIFEIIYNSFPPEKRTNEAVSITEDDIINYWKKYPSV